MKKILTVSLIILSIFFLSSVVFAESTETTTSPNIVYVPAPVPPLKFRVGIKAGYARFYPLDSQLSGFYKGQLMLGGSIGAKANNGLELQLDTDYQMSNNSSFSTIKLEVVPVILTLRYHPLKNSQISPFFGGGLGLFYIREKSNSYDYLKSFQLGKTILMGADIKFSPNTILRLEARKDYVGNVSNDLYYRANFGGLKATVGVVFEVPLKRNPSGVSSNSPENNNANINWYEDRINQLNNRINELEYEISQLEKARKYHYWGWSGKYCDEDDLLWEIRRLRYKLKNYQNNLNYVTLQKEQKEHDAYIEARKAKKEEAMKEKKSTTEAEEYKSKKNAKTETKSEEGNKKKSKEEEEHEKYLEERLKKKNEAKNK